MNNKLNLAIIGQGRSGGVVFDQEHNIMPDVPPENILAMYRAVKDSTK